MFQLPENFESFNQAGKPGEDVAGGVIDLVAALAAAKQKTIDWNGV